MPLPTSNPSLTNADQIVTKVDKTDHRQPPGASRTNLNKPEQIRTNPNTAERPDQIGTPSESPPNTPKKSTLNTAVAHSQPPTLLLAVAPRTHARPQDNSIPPPFQGEVRWGVRRTARAAMLACVCAAPS